MGILVTILFLLADGAPAKDASVSCTGVATYAAGDDTQEPTSHGYLILDSRGAVILSAAPGVIDCIAVADGHVWMGSIPLKTHGQRIRIVLQKGDLT